MITHETTTSSRAIIRHVIADDVTRKTIDELEKEEQRQEMSKYRQELE